MAKECEHNCDGSHHGHAHHGYSYSGGKKALFISFILITAFMVVEFAGGLISGSLALISDAGHMLSDAFALGLSLAAVTVGQRAATRHKTYGYKRFEVLAAFVNAIILLALAALIVKEAVSRIASPPEILSGYMLVIAVIGLIVNIVVFFILHGGGARDNINIRSALLHVVGDMLGSVGAIAAALLIFFFGWNIADPIISVLVALLILYSAWRILSESVNILLEGVPVHISAEALKAKIAALENVQDVHDLHIWTISSNLHLLTAHITVECRADRDLLLKKVKELIFKETKIDHATIQLEGPEAGCGVSCSLK